MLIVGITEDEAINLAKNRMLYLESLRNSLNINTYVGTRLKFNTIRKIENIIQGLVWEVVILPELRSTDLAWTLQNIMHLLKQNQNCLKCLY